MERVTGRLMGTTVRVRATGARRAFRDARRLERTLTRFHDSPLTRLNRDGELVAPPEALVAALEHAVRVARDTGGLVTPAVLDALEAAGYDADFRRLPPRAPAAARAARPAPPVDGIVVSRERVSLPRGVRVDLGGTAKTWIVERVADGLRGEYVFDAGGDLSLRRYEPCVVLVEHPFGDAPVPLELPPGRWGVATSSVLRRAWPGAHHLIDPRTGRPLESRFVQVTAVARRATTAEVLTKLAFLDERALAASVAGALVLAFETAGGAHALRGGRFEPLDLNAVEAA